MNKLSDIKIGKKATKQKETINNIEKKKRLLIFFRDYIEMLSDANYNARYNKTDGTGLKILTLKQMLQRLRIALTQVKAGNNSESLLNEIGQIVYSLYQINKKVYNNIIKPIQ